MVLSSLNRDMHCDGEWSQGRCSGFLPPCAPLQWQFGGEGTCSVLELMVQPRSAGVPSCLTDQGVWFGTSYWSAKFSDPSSAGYPIANRGFDRGSQWSREAAEMQSC